MILMSVGRPKIVGAAGSRITPARRQPGASLEPGKARSCRAHLTSGKSHPQLPGDSNVPVNFEEPVSNDLAWRFCGDVRNKPDQATRPDAIRELAEQGLAELQRITDEDDR